MAGTIDGAWVPEPWATRLIKEGGAKVLVDERDLWPDGKYVTTHLMVATKFLDGQPGGREADPARDRPGRRLRQREPGRGAGDRQRRDREVDDQEARRGPARRRPGTTSTFTVDPVASSLQKSADDAASLGLLKTRATSTGLYDLALAQRDPQGRSASRR